MDLSKISTKRLVDELRNREGVYTQIAGPYEPMTIDIDGPAIVLVVIVMTNRGTPYLSYHLGNILRKARDGYNQSHKTKIPPCSPHVLRHTFCTNMLYAGIDPKSLQYIMGHSDIDMTLNVYADTNYSLAEKAFKKALSASTGT